MHRVRVRVVEDALDANATIARANRADFDRHGVTVVNVMSAPGAGKTSAARARAGASPRPRRPARRRAGGRRRRARLDADRLAHLHVPGDAAQHRQRLRRRVPPRREHGALGPAVGAARRARPAHRRERRQPRLPGRVPASARTRGSWSPRSPRATTSRGKYPLMFRACELVVVNKIDLLEHVDFSMDRFDGFLDAVHPGVERLRVSARTGEGRRRAARLAGGGCPTGWARRPDAAPPRRSTSASPAASGSSAPRPTGSRGSATRWPSASRAAGGSSRSASSPADASDVRHVAVEFVHPVIVGKRALPGARACRARDVGAAGRRPTTSRWPSATGRRSTRRCGRRGARRADRRLRAVGAEWAFDVPTADPFVAPGAGRDDLPRAVGARARLLRAPRAARRAATERPRARRRRVLASSIPFLGEAEDDLDAVLADVRGSVLAKAGGGRRRCATQTLADGREALAAAAGALRGALRRRRARCSRSATAARRPTRWTPSPTCARPPPPWLARPAIDLDRGRRRSSPRVANDVGRRARCSRARSSRTAVPATRCSRSRRAAARRTCSPRSPRRAAAGSSTIALVGYDGGRIAAERLADHVVVTRSRAHPAHPGGAGQRVARAARLSSGDGRTLAGPRLGRRPAASASASRAWSRAWASGPSSTASRASSASPGSSATTRAA